LAEAGTDPERHDYRHPVGELRVDAFDDLERHGLCTPLVSTGETRPLGGVANESPSSMALRSACPKCWATIPTVDGASVNDA
jgi:hypothetical protein